MKTIFFILLFLSFEIFSSAQVVIWQGNMPTDGSNCWYIESGNVSTPPGPSGANVVWDFSSLFFSGGMTKSYSSDTGSYTNLGYWRGTGLYYSGADYHSDNTKFSCTETWNSSGGPGGYSAGIDYTDELAQLTFPFTYGNNFLDSFYFSRWIHPNTGNKTYTYSGSGLDSTIADGWGTLIVDSTDTFNVIRVYSYDVYFDTISGGHTNRIEESWSWHSDQFRGPVLICIVSGTDYYYEYFPNNPQAVSTPEISKTETPSISSFGNGNFRIHFDSNKNQNFECIVSDVAGKIISEKIISGSPGESPIDLSAFSEGLYFLTLYNSEQRFTFKLASFR